MPTYVPASEQTIIIMQFIWLTTNTFYEVIVVYKIAQFAACFMIEEHFFQVLLEFSQCW